MAITVRDAQAAMEPGDSGTIDVPVPGNSDGDMLVLAVRTAVDDASPTVSGWTQEQVSDDYPSQADGVTTILTRVASGEPSSYTVDLGGSWISASAAVMLALANVDAVGTSGKTNPGGGLQTSNPGVSLSGVGAGDFVVQVFGTTLDSWDGSSYTLSGPGGQWSDDGYASASGSDPVPSVLATTATGAGSAPTASTDGEAVAWAMAAVTFTPAAVSEEHSLSVTAGIGISGTVAEAKTTGLAGSGGLSLAKGFGEAKTIPLASSTAVTVDVDAGQTKAAHLDAATQLTLTGQAVEEKSASLPAGTGVGLTVDGGQSKTAPLAADAALTLDTAAGITVHEAGVLNVTAFIALDTAVALVKAGALDAAVDLGLAAVATATNTIRDLTIVGTGDPITHWTAAAPDSRWLPAAPTTRAWPATAPTGRAYTATTPRTEWATSEAASHWQAATPATRWAVTAPTRQDPR